MDRIPTSRRPTRSSSWRTPARQGSDSVRRLDGGAEEAAPRVNVIRVRENGPLAVSADIALSSPAGEIDALRLTLCRCGDSKNKPFCDSSHKQAGFLASGEPATGDVGSLAVRDGKLEIRPTPNGPLVVSGNVEILHRHRPNHRQADQERALPLRPFRQQALLRRHHKTAGFIAD